MLKAYGFRDEQEALAYKRNPIDNLQPIAAAGIPILCVCGETDTIVPMAENIDIVRERYEGWAGK